ncbi:hypothetical protein GWI33_019595 [Rhynchophorus ferrugineus]|uniref:Uncharacterized protein n=1 Tax=Rhynchophorus ferrugineus TaxID=354439 RepID=A0A834HTC5_RHYFE|nr:hypothetical protein GWI33_019595 [Rhynchophorus ferrugineus]
MDTSTQNSKVCLFRGGSSKSPTMNHSPTLYGDHMSANQFIQASLMDENNLAFMPNPPMIPGRHRDRSESPPHDHHIRYLK